LAPELVEEEDATETIHEITSKIRTQIQDRYDIVKDLKSLERKFRKKHKKFNSEVEEHRAFLDFIDLLHSQEVISTQEKEQESIPFKKNQKYMK